MIRVMLGLTLLTGAMLVPLGHAMALQVFPDAQWQFALTRVLIAYLGGAVIVAVFIRRTCLAQRLATPAPGMTLISLGIAAFIVLPALIAFLMTYRLPNPLAFLPQNGLVMFPGIVLLAAGCAQLLLGARERTVHPGPVLEVGRQNN